MGRRKQPRLAPVGLEVGDRYKSPFGDLRIVEIRGDRADGEDTREWYVRDEETGEELWVDHRFLIEVMLANCGKKHGSRWD